MNASTNSSPAFRKTALWIGLVTLAMLVLSQMPYGQMSAAETAPPDVGDVLRQSTIPDTPTTIYLPMVMVPPPPPRACPPPNGCSLEGVTDIQGMAVDESTNRIYVASKESNQLLMIDASTVISLGVAATGSEPWGVAVDETERRVYVSNYGSGDVWIYDADSLAVLAKIDVGDNPGLMAILPGLDVVMVTVGEGSQLAVIKGTQLVQTVWSNGTGPFGIVADEVNTRFLISNRTSGHLVAFVQDGVTDGSQWVRVRGPVLDDGRTLFNVAHNPANDKLYLSYAQADGDWLVDVWKADVGNIWGLIREIPVGSGGSLNSADVGGVGIGVNRTTDNLFHLNTAASSMTVVNGADNGIRDNVALGADPFTLTIDESRSIVYIGLRAGASLVKVNDTFR